MERTAFRELKAWKEHGKRKPLIVRGVRQCGKTWLIKEFGRREYARVAYINFESSKLMQSLFEVKAEENLQAKSLKTYCEKFHPALAVRSSMSDYREESWLVNVPLYATSQIENLE